MLVNAPCCIINHWCLPEKAMKVLIGCLSTKEAEMRCMGASALWALLHNNQRVRAHVHDTSIAPSSRAAFLAGCLSVLLDSTAVSISHARLSCQQAKTTLKSPSVRLRIEEAHNLSKKGINTSSATDVELRYPEFHFDASSFLHRRGRQAGSQKHLPAEVPRQPVSAAKHLTV